MVLAPCHVPAAQTVRLFDPTVGLDGAIVIHSTTLGPAAGGCRFWHYPSEREAIADAARLAEGMAYKNAMAGLPLGGGKAVLRVPAGHYDRAALFKAFGRAVEALEGRYITAEDVGTCVGDMQEIANCTRYVAGREARIGQAGGDPSRWTALGVLEAMRAATRLVLGADLRDIRVAVQGVGNVGTRLARLLAMEGAELVLADLDRERAQNLGCELGARVVEVAAIAAQDTDVFAPCALGSTLSLQSVPAIRARLVCGAANNQLASPDVTEMLRDLGITYVPDFVANAGGIISVAAEYFGERSDCVHGRVIQIGPRVAAILENAQRQSVSPADLALNMAQQMIAREKTCVM